MRMPEPRGPLSEHVLEALASPVHRLAGHPEIRAHSMTDDDLHLALYLCYELHYTAIDDVDPGWEWEPSLLEFRRDMEDAFEKELTLTDSSFASEGDIASTLATLAESDSGCALGRYLEKNPSIERFKEFVAHRSAYQLKEADPHSWVIPRLGGRAKAALIEIQSDEYGGGKVESMHAVLFRDTMRALGLDDSYGAYVRRLPGVTLAGVNLMSFFGLHRRWRGAIVGHLALFEMTSTEPNRRYGNALRKLGFGRAATHFYDEHVEADAVHEAIAAHDLAGSLAREEPDIAADIEFGARCLQHLDELWCSHVIEAWEHGRSSLL
ncbi:MAG: iron-containing redox enzyme family protein [Actinomycetota bacterium]|nr:iron-containing redox enzyme family protein [Actinomycetota bacterium]